jgi:hypothetical protein
MGLARWGAGGESAKILWAKGSRKREEGGQRKRKTEG